MYRYTQVQTQTSISAILLASGYPCSLEWPGLYSPSIEPLLSALLLLIAWKDRVQLRLFIDHLPLQLCQFLLIPHLNNDILHAYAGIE